MNEETSKWIKWTDSYDLWTEKDDHFRTFISEDEDGAIYACCLYYEGKRVLKAPGQSRSLEF